MTGIRRRADRTYRNQVISKKMMDGLMTAQRTALASGLSIDGHQSILGAFIRRERPSPLICGFLDEPLGPDVDYACMSVYMHQPAGWTDTGYNIRVYDHSNAWSGECGDFVVAYLERKHFQVIAVKCIERGPHVGNCDTTAATTDTACETLQNTLRVSVFNETGCASYPADVFDLTQSGGSWTGTHVFNFGTLNLSLDCTGGTFNLTWEFTALGSCCQVSPSSDEVVPDAIEFGPLRATYTITFDTTDCEGCTDAANQSFTVRITELDPLKTCASVGITIRHGTIVCRCADGVYSVDLQALAPENTCSETATGTGTGSELGCVEPEEDGCCGVIGDDGVFTTPLGVEDDTGTGTSVSNCVQTMTKADFPVEGDVTTVTAYDIDGFNLPAGTPVLVAEIDDRWWIIRVGSDYTKVTYMTNVTCEEDENGAPIFLKCFRPKWEPDVYLCPEECEFVPTGTGTGTGS